MNRRSRNRAWLGVGLLLAAAACADSGTVGPEAADPQMNHLPGLNDEVTVCKTGPTGTYGDFTASIPADANQAELKLSSFRINTTGTDLADRVCVLVWQGSSFTTVTITETPGPGTQLNQVAVNGVNIVPVSHTVSVDVGNGGAAVIFKNVEADDLPLTATKTAAGTFDRRFSWQLTKTVAPTSHSGNAGEDAGSSTWTVAATQTVVENNYSVAGNIVVSNANGFPVDFGVTDVLNDGTVGVVTCPSYTVAANGSVTCTYTAAPADGSATLNTATVSSSVGGAVATAPVSFAANVIGDATVTLGDVRFSYSQSISESTTVPFPETFPCPADASLYTNGTYVRTETNTATLVGATTDLSADAEVTITCVMQAQGETATGAGYDWSATQGAPSTWFMYTPWSATNFSRWGRIGLSTSAPLIAGQHYVAGTLTGTRTSGSTGRTSITITLNNSFDFAPGVLSQVKIHPMACGSNQPYVSPGQFAVHRTVAGGKTITVPDLPNTACYGIHVDVVHAGQ